MLFNNHSFIFLPFILMYPIKMSITKILLLALTVILEINTYKTLKVSIKHLCYLTQKILEQKKLNKHLNKIVFILGIYGLPQAF